MMTKEVTVELETKQANDKYIFGIKQQEEKILCKFQKALDYVTQKVPKLKEGMDGHHYSRNFSDMYSLLKGYYSDGPDLIERMKELLEFKMTPDLLYFTFGKYKDRIVQDVLQEDRKYCKWFSNNVCGKDLPTLTILDYLHKELSGLDYNIKSKKFVLQDILLTYIPMEWHKYIDKEEILGTKHYNDCSFPDYYYDDRDDWMFDVLDYGDLC